MSTMMQLSHILSIAVLIPVSVALAANRPGTTRVFGERSPARGILQSIYFSILVMSAALLVVRDPRSIAALLAVQVVYKLTTPFTVGTLRNPVVLSNLGIVSIHLASPWSARATLG